MPPSDDERTDAAGPDAAGPVVPEGPVERVCRWLCGLGLAALVAVVAVEVVTRNLLGFSFQVSDELGGYITVGISFLSLSVCQVGRSYHHVEFLQARLGARGRAASRILFGLVCLAAAGVLTWQLGRLAWNSWLSGDEAPTLLMTPLWMPQLLMPLGMAALVVSLLRTLLAELRLLGRAPRRGAGA